MILGGSREIVRPSVEQARSISRALLLHGEVALRTTKAPINVPEGERPFAASVSSLTRSPKVVHGQNGNSSLHCIRFSLKDEVVKNVIRIRLPC